MSWNSRQDGLPEGAAAAGELAAAVPFEPGGEILFGDGLGQPGEVRAVAVLQETGDQKRSGPASSQKIALVITSDEAPDA